MWIGKIEELKDCTVISEKITASILDFIKNNDMSSLSNGRHDICDGVYVNVFEYDTKENTDNVFEIHKDYIDIHYAINNSEKVLLAEKFDSITTLYQKDGDYALGIAENYKAIDLKDGVVCLCLPDELHKAGVVLDCVEKVKKAVFKIRIS